MSWVLLAIGVAVLAVLGWGWFEAGWVRLVTLPCPVEGLPAELEGVRIAHLSDFHLGVPSRGTTAVRRAAAWVRERRPDAVFVTGDLLTRPRGQPLLHEALSGLPPAWAVLGNHDVGVAKDPLAKRAERFDPGPARLLLDEADELVLRGVRVHIVGADPRSWLRGKTLPLDQADASAPFRILLHHFPEVFDWLPGGVFQLVLAGHIHDGQIALPYWRGRFLFASPRARYTRGIYRRGGTTMHVSAGLGTTFVPFRLFARPEATELVLQRA